MKTQSNQFSSSRQSSVKVYQSVNKNLLDSQVRHIYRTYFKLNNEENILQFQQIDHSPQQVSQQLFRIEQKCLVINFKAFDLYYPTLFRIIMKKTQQQEKTNQQQICKLLEASDIILAFNGENDRAWNVKKFYLQKRKIKGEKYLNLQWQLGFNATVCLKNKKSSSYYQYRLLLIQRELRQLISQYTFNKNKKHYQYQSQSQQQQYQQFQQQSQQKQQQKSEEQQKYQQNYTWSSLQEGVQRILQRQHALIERVLARYFRNYFCWMYRIKLIQLITNSFNKYFITTKHDQMRINNSYLHLNLSPQTIKNIQRYVSTMKNIQRLHKQVISHEHMNIHKFIGKYCNDYSGYSYMISFINKYYIKQHSINTKIYNKDKVITSTIIKDKIITNNQHQDIKNKQKDKHDHSDNQLVNKENQLNKSNLIDLLQRQKKWIDQLQQYCQLVYSSKQHYKHLLMYKNHIESLLKQLSLQ